MEAQILATTDPHLLGERIAESRRARHLTQQQVADALNLSRATVIATEKGERRPKARELVALSRLFSRPVADFVAETPLTGEPGFAVYFSRTLQRLSAGEAAELGPVIERFERYCRWYVEMEESLDSPLPLRYPEPYDIEGTPIDRAAEEVAISERNRLGLGDSPIANLAALLETDAGVRIIPIDAGNTSIASMYLMTDRHGACIALSASQPEEHQRLDIAHAYAHLLTNRQRPAICLAGKAGRASREERFADAFAGAFLMPASGVQRRFDAIRRAKHGRPVTLAEVMMLASFYRVPFQVMVGRLKDLRLLPSSTAAEEEHAGNRPAHASVSPLVGRPRFTARYVMLAAQAFEEGLLTEGQLAERLATDRVGARAVVDGLASAYRLGDDDRDERVSLDPMADRLGAD